VHLATAVEMKEQQHKRINKYFIRIRPLCIGKMPIV
jgi:hypothetical protein